jgi:putative endopeptidase
MISLTHRALAAPSTALLAGYAASSAAQGRRGAAAAIGAWGVDLTARDTSVNPGDDFFRYASGAEHVEIW